MDNFNITKTVEDNDDFIEYGFDFLTNKGDRVFITEYETALLLADELEGLINEVDVLDRTSNDIEIDDFVYIKKLADDVFTINDLFDEHGDMDEIEADFILLEDGLLVDNVIDEYIIAFEELEIIGVEEEVCTCEDCCGDNCTCNKEVEVDEYDLLDEAEKEFIDDISSNCGYRKDVLAFVFAKGYYSAIDEIVLRQEIAIEEGLI